MGRPTLAAIVRSAGISPQRAAYRCSRCLAPATGGASARLHGPWPAQLCTTSSYYSRPMGRGKTNFMQFSLPSPPRNLLQAPPLMSNMINKCTVCNLVTCTKSTTLILRRRGYNIWILVNHDIQLTATHLPSEIALEIIVMGCWNIWIQRNEKIFNFKPFYLQFWKSMPRNELLLFKHRIKNKFEALLTSWIDRVLN